MTNSKACSIFLEVIPHDGMTPPQGFQALQGAGFPQAFFHREQPDWHSTAG